MENKQELVKNGSFKPEYFKKNTPVFDGLFIYFYNLKLKAKLFLGFIIPLGFLLTFTIFVIRYFPKIEIFILGVWLLVLGLIWAYLISSSFSTSVSQVLRVVEDIVQGNLDRRINVKSMDEVGALAASFNDVTSIMQLYRITLEQEKAKNNAILEAVGDGVFTINKSGKIILFNHSASDLSDFSEKEALGKPYQEVLKFLPADDSSPPWRLSEDKENIAQDFISQALLGEKVAAINSDLLMERNGKRFSVVTSATPLKSKDGQVIGCTVVFRDVTQERRVDRMKTEFISLASHQLKTPLSAIRWFAEMLLAGDAGELTKEQRKFVENIDQSNRRMIALVDSLLNISRIESGRIIVDPQPTDLGELVDNIVTDLKPRLLEKKQSLVISTHKGLPKISIDPKLVGNVYMNLLTNAIKYTPSGGEISVFISRKDEMVISQVSDTGFGIPRDEQDKIFQRFYRGTNVVKIETDGTGLGLYLAKAIVESSGGKIWFRSEIGKGTTFWFSLPVAGTPAQEGEVTLDS